MISESVILKLIFSYLLQVVNQHVFKIIAAIKNSEWLFTDDPKQFCKQKLDKKIGRRDTQWSFWTQFYKEISAYKGPGSHGVMDGAVACRAKGPGFDSSFIHMFFSLRS